MNATIGDTVDRLARQSRQIVILDLIGLHVKQVKHVELHAQADALMSLLDADTVAHQVVDLGRGLETQGDAWEGVARKLCGR